MPKGLERQLRKQGKRCVGNGRETGDAKVVEKAGRGRLVQEDDGSLQCEE